MNIQATIQNAIDDSIRSGDKKLITVTSGSDQALVLKELTRFEDVTTISHIPQPDRSSEVWGTTKSGNHFFLRIEVAYRNLSSI